MENINLQKKGFEEIVTTFKGVDPLLLEKLDKDKKIGLIKIALKELLVLTENAKTGASTKLANLFKKIGNQLTTSILLNINSLILFGDFPNTLTESKRKKIERLEIQQEMNHFNRIMGLDSLISGNFNFPLNQNEALRQCKDFARFIWLVNERRFPSKNGFNPLDMSTQVKIQISKTSGLITSLNSKNFSILIFSEEKDLSGQFDIAEATNVFAKFVTDFGLDSALPLFDYFLFLINTDLKLKLISAKEVSENKGFFVQVKATGGKLLVTKTTPLDFKTNIIKLLDFEGNKNSQFGAFGSVEIKKKIVSIKDSRLGIFLLPKLSNASATILELVSALNQTNSTGKIFLINNLNNFLSKNGGDLFGQLKLKNKPLVQLSSTKSGSIKNIDKFLGRILKANSISIESAHLHADRSFSETQLATVRLRNKLVSFLRKKSFEGRVYDFLMIDDYHVVNSLNYKNYFLKLKEFNFNPDEVIPESSPLIRAISVDLLMMLLTKRNLTAKVSLRQGNLYLTFKSGKTIELVEGPGKKDILGCVLFDCAFTLFKRNPHEFVKVFQSSNKNNTKDNINKKIIDFYINEKDPIKRRAFLDELDFPLPKFRNLKLNSGLTFLDKVSLKKQCEVINIHESFYRPQQAKVNALLEVFGFPKLLTLYINPVTGNEFIEQSEIINN